MGVCLQIFQWLATMPVELEGYIRPGCTILTVFIAMPSFMWMKVMIVVILLYKSKTDMESFSQFSPYLDSTFLFDCLIWIW